MRQEKVTNPELYNDPIFDSNLLRYRVNVQNRGRLINDVLERHRTLQRLIREELPD